VSDGGPGRALHGMWSCEPRRRDERVLSARAEAGRTVLSSRRARVGSAGERAFECGAKLRVTEESRTGQNARVLKRIGRSADMNLAINRETPGCFIRRDAPDLMRNARHLESAFCRKGAECVRDLLELPRQEGLGLMILEVRATFRRTDPVDHDGACQLNRRLGRDLVKFQAHVRGWTIGADSDVNCGGL
jgi:hypothetical protein